MLYNINFVISDTDIQLATIVVLIAILLVEFIQLTVLLKNKEPREEKHKEKRSLFQKKPKTPERPQGFFIHIGDNYVKYIPRTPYEFTIKLKGPGTYNLRIDDE